MNHGRIFRPRRNNANRVVVLFLPDSRQTGDLFGPGFLLLFQTLIRLCFSLGGFRVGSSLCLCPSSFLLLGLQFRHFSISIGFCLRRLLDSVGLRDVSLDSVSFRSRSRKLFRSLELSFLVLLGGDMQPPCSQCYNENEQSGHSSNDCRRNNPTCCRIAPSHFGGASRRRM